MRNDTQKSLLGHLEPASVVPDYTARDRLLKYKALEEREAAGRGLLVSSRAERAEQFRLDMDDIARAASHRFSRPARRNARVLVMPEQPEDEGA